MGITLPNNFVFWGCFGFEERSLSVLSELVNQGLYPTKSYIFWNRPAISRIKTNFASFEKYTGKFSPIDIYYDHPIKTADIFISYLEKIKKQKVTDLLLDITTFTREWALILLAILNTDEFKKINVTIAYNFAATMSKEWLSMRPMQMRTVLGYPGKILPSRKNHLILILGHEIERAMAIIDEIEPAYVTVVTGSKEGSVTEAMLKRNHEFKDFIVNNYSNISNHEQINVRDFFEARDSIKKIVDAKQEYNIIIAPLNTKLSTLAAGIVALENKNIQICYMPMEQYNFNDFSTPSTSTVFFKLD